MVAGGPGAADVRPLQDAAPRYMLAFDTANEVVSIGVGALDPAAKTITPVATVEVRAHRA